MIELAAVSIVGILVALIIAALVYIVCSLFLPQPVPILIALLVLVIGLFSGISVG